MKRLPFLLVALALVFACTDTPTQPAITLQPEVLFGVEPMPFFPSATNELNAAAQHLEVIGGHIGELCPLHPPDPCTPTALPATAVLGVLGAANNQLPVVHSKVERFLQPPPDDGSDPPEEFTAAVVQAFAGARWVWDEAIRAKMGFEPMPFHPAHPAFEEVKAGAIAIMLTISETEYCPVDVAGPPQCQLPADVVIGPGLG